MSDPNESTDHMSMRVRKAVKQALKQKADENRRNLSQEAEFRLMQSLESEGVDLSIYA